MKNLILFLAIGLFIVGCDKIENPYKDNIITKGTAAYDSSSLNKGLYPGNWEDYLSNYWPVFPHNANTNRNVLIEDFTGHMCPNCPAGANIAHQIVAAHPDRAFIASIHAGPSVTGITNFQETEPGLFSADFTNPQGLGYGIFFNDGFGFIGNPRGPINRSIFGSEQMFTSPTSWSSNATNMINENNLKVNIQAKVNYFSPTRGLFLHVEVDAIADLPASARCVVYFIQNEVIAPQKNGPLVDTNYHHKDIHRGNIDGQLWGQPLLSDGAALLAGKNALMYYSYKIPQEYDPAKCHLLIYIMNNDTKEIYQVIKAEIM